MHGSVSNRICMGFTPSQQAQLIACVSQSRCISLLHRPYADHICWIKDCKRIQSNRDSSSYRRLSYCHDWVLDGLRNCTANENYSIPFRYQKYSAKAISCNPRCRPIVTCRSCPMSAMSCVHHRLIPIQRSSRHHLIQEYMEHRCRHHQPHCPVSKHDAGRSLRRLLSTDSAMTAAAEPGA